MKVKSSIPKRELKRGDVMVRRTITKARRKGRWARSVKRVVVRLNKLNPRRKVRQG